MSTSTKLQDDDESSPLASTTTNEQQASESNYSRNLSLDLSRRRATAGSKQDAQRQQQIIAGNHERFASNCDNNNKSRGHEHEHELHEHEHEHEDQRQQSSSTGQDDGESDQNNRTTDGQTMMHILKANIGTGVLAMPLAFKNVGLWLGLGLVPIIGIICIHCMNILIQSHNQLCDRFNYESLDYDQVAALGLACGPRWARRLAKRASIIVTTFLMFTQIGFCCVYILFTVENLQVACMNLFQLDYSLITYLIIVFPIIGLTSCTSNLKHLARISTLANILQLFGLALIFFDLLHFHTFSQDQQAAGPIVVQQGFSSDISTGLPLFFATAVYAFEGIGVVLPLVKEMQDPRRITGVSGVLNTAMSSVALLYMAMGFFGYSKYGQTVAGSITLNLPQATHNELVRLAFALAIGLSYSLQFYVPWTIVWPLIDESLFYAYRPRKPRNKLQILSKLSAENQWAIDELLASDANASSSADEHSTASHQRDAKVMHEQQAQQQQQMYAGNSLATTMATSYSISMSTKLMAPNSNQQQSFGQRKRMAQSSASLSQQQYGTIGMTTSGGGGQLLRNVPSGTRDEWQAQRHKRNRMHDVMNDPDEEDSMPDVQWRPPPRSMRGKRKLVRYTVILLTVSFTFVAAALIPRLDLFISLIGALASSCLAIIFPAIIQLCTFWNYSDDEQQEEEDDDEQDGSSEQHEDELCLCATTRTPTMQQQQQQTGAKQLAGNCRHCWSVGKRHRRLARKRLLWFLFALKNIFLLLFGILGLITGTWVSMRQLGVATV